MAQEQPSAANVTFRPGQRTDWAAVQQVIANTWPEGDYITEDLWNEWATTSGGHLYAVEADGKLIGFGRLTELGQGDWWIEGMRVDPAVRGKGYGRALMAHLIATFGKVGFGLLRMMTDSSNGAMSKMAHGHGFKHIQSYVPLEGAAQPNGDYGNYKILQPANLQLLRAYLTRSPMNRINHFVEHERTFYYLNHERLEGYITNPNVQVLGWRQNNQLSGVAIVFAPYQDQPVGEVLPVGYMDAPDDTTFGLMLAGLGGLARKMRYHKIGWAMPLAMGLERWIGPGGFTKTWGDDEMWLYERPVTAGLAPSLDI
jgi:GNAT superfamily N-acetyltransferase